MAIRVRCFPATDREFFEHVHRVTRDLNRLEAQSPDAVQRVLEELRSRFPQCRISIREGLAILTPDEPVWYAYRDGTPGAPGPGAVVRRVRSTLSNTLRRAARRRPQSPPGIPPIDLRPVAPPIAPVEATAIAEPAIIAASEPGHEAV